ncbi:MAG: NAD-dependent epimerase/dehydratase family protein, partial [Desulfobacterales bacterium]
MNKNSKIYIAGHTGLVGSALYRRLETDGYSNLIVRNHSDLDLTRQIDVESFFKTEKPAYVFLAAAKVGGIMANYAYPAEFIYRNLAIQNNVIHAVWKTGVKRLLFLGSSCIYPKECPQPMKEEYLLTGPLEPTNEPYAVAKIAGIKMCQAYNRQYGTQYLCVMPTNLYGPNDNFDLETSHVLPALIRKFHLAKLAYQQEWEEIRKDEQMYGRIPDDVKESMGIVNSSQSSQPG